MRVWCSITVLLKIDRFNFVKSYWNFCYFNKLHFQGLRSFKIQKILIPSKTLVGKLDLNWPYSPALPHRQKFKYNFPAKVDLRFFGGFHKKISLYSHSWQFFISYLLSIEINFLFHKIEKENIKKSYFL